MPPFVRNIFPEGPWRAEDQLRRQNGQPRRRGERKYRYRRPEAAPAHALPLRPAPMRRVSEPSEAEIWDWNHRYDRDCCLPHPAVTTIDHQWYLHKKLKNTDGAFNGGIDFVEEKATGIVAVRKRLCPHPANLPNEIDHWRREMLVLRKLDHPNIPYYLDGFYAPTAGSIYMQPCRLGNVSRFADSRGNLQLDHEQREFFLWHILHGVAQAVLYMQTGFRSLAEADQASRPRVRGWVTLVHADIRPDQIFLDSSRDPNHPAPQVLLGDFGFCQFIKPWHRTERHDGPGARSRSKAPEFPDEISMATDIYGIGATVQLYIQPERDVQGGLKTGWLTQFRTSMELDSLACECVANRPGDRPSIREVLRMVEAGLRRRKKLGLKMSSRWSGLLDPVF